MGNNRREPMWLNVLGWFILVLLYTALLVMLCVMVARVW